jgi:hypothetical protein
MKLTDAKETQCAEHGSKRGGADQEHPAGARGEKVVCVAPPLNISAAKHPVAIAKCRQMRLRDAIESIESTC